MSSCWCEICNSRDDLCECVVIGGPDFKMIIGEIIGVREQLANLGQGFFMPTIEKVFFPDGISAGKPEQAGSSPDGTGETIK